MLECGLPDFSNYTLKSEFYWNKKDIFSFWEYIKLGRRATPLNPESSFENIFPFCPLLNLFRVCPSFLYWYRYLNSKNIN